MSRQYILVDPAIQKLEKRVDINIEDLLHKSQLPDDAKVKLLSELITKFRGIRETPIEPLPVSFSESNKDPDNNVTDNKQDSELLKDAIQEDIHLTTPKNFKKYVTPIIERLKMFGLSWNEKGQLVYENWVIKESNIIDLFSYLMRSRKSDPPEGFQILFKVVKESHIPQSWIGNTNLWSKLKRQTLEDEASPLSLPERRKKRKKTKSPIAYSFQTPPKKITWDKF